MLERFAPIFIGLIALMAWIWRALPFFSADPFAVPIDYDEGVYFAASALLARGEVPYRDFVFVHPPGVLIALLPASVWSYLSGPAAAFAMARWLATGVGAANALLCGALARRHFGALAGVAAALFYATYPEAVGVDRGPFLEPFLNLACLGFAWVWLGPKRRDGLAGALAGFAVAIKIVAGSYCLAAVASRVRWDWRRVARLAGFAAGACALLVAPFVVLAPSEFFTDVFWFQLVRPPDGTTELAGRLADLLNKRHPITPWLAAVGFGLAAARWRRPDAEAERFFATAWALTLVGFMASKSYWAQYNSHLAPTEAVMAGLGGSWLLGLVLARVRQPVLAALISASLLLAALPAGRQMLRMARWRTPEVAQLGSALRATLPPEQKLFAFEPAWGLAANRLPTRLGGALVVDSYGFMLLSAMRDGSGFGHAAEALRSPQAQAAVAPVLREADAIVLGSRGEAQLDDSTRASVTSLRRLEAPGPSVYLR